MNRLLNDRNKTRAILLFGFLVLTVLLSWKLLGSGGQAEAEAATESAASSGETSRGTSPADRPSHSGDTKHAVNANVLHGVHLPVPAGQLLANVPEGAGGLAVTDEEGNVYYTQVNVRDEALLFRRDADGDDQMLWSTQARGRQIEVAGRDGDKLIIVFPPAHSTALTCSPPASAFGRITGTRS